jgi:predicted RNA-binding protein with TRAM domain
MQDTKRNSQVVTIRLSNSWKELAALNTAPTKPKPVEVGKEYDVTISEISRRGDGIAKIDGFVIFVAGAKQGWQGKIKVTQVANNYAKAEALTTPPVEAGKEYEVTITDLSQRGDGIAKIDGFVIFVSRAKIDWTGKVKVTEVLERCAKAEKVEAEKAEAPCILPNKGDELEVTVSSMSKKGDKGLALVNGLVVLIEGVKEGWTGTVKVTGFSKNGTAAFAELPNAPSKKRQRINYNRIDYLGEQRRKQDTGRRKKGWSKATVPKETGTLLNVKPSLDNQVCVLCGEPTVVTTDSNGVTLTTSEELEAAMARGDKVTRIKLSHEGAHSRLLGQNVVQAPKAPAVKTITKATRRLKAITKAATPVAPKATTKFIISWPRADKYGSPVLAAIASRPWSTINEVVSMTDLPVSDIQKELEQYKDRLEVTGSRRYAIRGQNDVRAKMVHQAPREPTPQFYEPLSTPLLDVATFKVGRRPIDEVEQNRRLMEYGIIPVRCVADHDQNIILRGFAAGYGPVRVDNNDTNSEIELVPLMIDGEPYYYVGGGLEYPWNDKPIQYFHGRLVLDPDKELPEVSEELAKSLVENFRTVNPVTKRLRPIGPYVQAAVPVRPNSYIVYIDGVIKNSEIHPDNIVINVFKARELRMNGNKPRLIVQRVHGESSEIIAKLANMPKAENSDLSRPLYALTYARKQPTADGQSVQVSTWFPNKGYYYMRVLRSEMMSENRVIQEDPQVVAVGGQLTSTHFSGTSA